MQRDNGRINYGVTLDNSQLRIDAQQSKRIIEDVGSTAVSEGNKMDNALRKVGTAMAGVFAVAKLKEYVTEVAKVRGEFQQLEIAFNTMLGSKAQADALMSQLIKTAATTPFNMGDIANSAKQLLAYGVEAEKVNETLIRLGDIAAGLSIPINDLAYLYGTTMVQGRLYTQDLNQFLGRGIPLTAELAKQFGVTESKVKTLVTEGKVGFPEVEKAIIALTSEGGKFGGLMEAQSKSITGQISNLEDAVEQMFNEIGKSSEGVISDSIGIIALLVENWRTVGSVILSVVAGYGAYKAAVITMNVVQKINNMLMAEAALQQKLAAMSGVQLSTAQAMAAAKTTLLTAAMNGLKAAIMSNPIGLILGVIATAITAFTAFSSSTSKATEMSKKFGDTAANTISRINTLTTTLKGLTEGTSTHKKVTDELNEILKEYGITQIREGDNIDTVNKKREQAIELIKQEAIERQRANALDTGLQDYQTALNDAKTELRDDLESTWVGDLWGLTDLHNELKENAAALTMIVGNYIDENISKIAGKTGEEYQKGLQEIFDGLKVRLKDSGFSDEVITEFTGDWKQKNKSGWYEYIGAVKEAAEQYDRYTVSINAAADAEKAAADSSMTWSEKIDATKRSLQGANDDVHKLYTNIKNLMSKYNKNTIGFDIVFNAKVPKWMESMKLSELKNLAAQFSALGDQAAKQGLSGMNVNGKYYTTQQLLQRGADYAQAAENKQQDADRKKREDEANEKERKRKAEQARKEAEREAKQIADQTADRMKAIQKYRDDVIASERQAELDIRQARLETLDDSFGKSKQLIELHYDRLTEENRKRMEEMLEALADNKLREWLNQHPKATKEEQLAYRNSLLDQKNPNHLTAEDLTEGQRNTLNAYGDIAEQIRLKETKDLYKRMLEEFQDYETRRLAIQKEYGEKRQALQEVQNADDSTKKNLIEGWDSMSAEQRATAWDAYVAKVTASIAELDRQEKDAIKSVNDEEMAAVQKSSTLLVDLFSDASDKSDKEIRKLIDDTKELLQYLQSTSADDITSKFGFTAEQLKTMKGSPEQLKAITEKLKALQETARKSNPFKTLADDIKALFEKNKDGNNKDSVEARLKKLGASASECADMVGDLAGNLATMFEAAGNDSMAQAMTDVQDVMNSVSNIGKGFAEGGLIGGIAAVAGEAIGWVTKAFQASARHAAALKEIMKEVTAQQRAYNLALLNESLEMEKATTVFGTLDYLKATNAVDVMRQAWADLRKEIEGTSEQQQKFAYKQTGSAFWNMLANQGYSQLKDAYSGLADISIKTGHKKTGLFGWGKGKDIYSSILDVYPELIDGQGKFNTELAKSILETRTFEGEGKEALQYMIDLAEKAEEAYQSVKDYLTGIFGELGNTMSDALVDAFRNGTDAAEAFGNSVSQMLEKIGQQMIFSTMFSQIIQNANDAMLDTMTNVSLTEEQKFNQYIAILDQMTSGILGQQDTYNALMKRYQELAAAKGIDIWQPDAEESSREASKKGIANASQESVDELNGRATAIQGHTFSINENTKLLVQSTNLILKSVQQIERNTDDVPQRLANLESNMKAVKDTVNDIALKGIKIKT